MLLINDKLYRIRIRLGAKNFPYTQNTVDTTFYWTQIKNTQHTHRRERKREEDVSFCKSSLTYHSHSVEILRQRGAIGRQKERKKFKLIILIGSNHLNGITEKR